MEQKKVFLSVLSVALLSGCATRQHWTETAGDKLRVEAVTLEKFELWDHCRKQPAQKTLDVYIEKCNKTEGCDSSGLTLENLSQEVIKPSKEAGSAAGALVGAEVGIIAGVLAGVGGGSPMDIAAGALAGALLAQNPDFVKEVRCFKSGTAHVRNKSGEIEKLNVFTAYSKDEKSNMSNEQKTRNLEILLSGGRSIYRVPIGSKAYMTHYKASFANTQKGIINEDDLRFLKEVYGNFPVED